jgi:hypothetical protein
MLAEIFGHQWTYDDDSTYDDDIEVNGGANHYILGFTVGVRMCKLLHEEHFTDL